MARLMHIVEARDVRGLLSLVDTQTVSSYGGGEMGRHAFAKTWKLHRGKASPIWPELRRILALGGVFSTGDEGREFRLPYAQATERISCELEDADWYSVAICLKPATEAHVRPSAESTVRVRLPYSVVNVNEEQDAGSAPWVRVSDMQGHALGYVRTDDLCFTADYKLILTPKSPGHWRMAAYAPYD
ncbi:hypothetical protein [Hymenobacter coalescens]